MRKLILTLIFALLAPSSLLAKGEEYEFRLSPLRDASKEEVLAMTGTAPRHRECGGYVMIYDEPVTKGEHVLFLVAKPDGRPHELVSRRARDIVFRTTYGEGMPTVVGVFPDRYSPAYGYVLYVPPGEFMVLRDCLKARFVGGEGDL